MFKRNSIFKIISDKDCFFWCSVSLFMQVYGVQYADCPRVLKVTHLRIITKKLIRNRYLLYRKGEIFFPWFKDIVLTGYGPCLGKFTQGFSQHALSKTNKVWSKYSHSQSCFLLNYAIDEGCQDVWNEKLDSADGCFILTSNLAGT